MSSQGGFQINRRNPKRARSGSYGGGRRRPSRLAAIRIPRQLSKATDIHYFKETYMSNDVVVHGTTPGLGFYVSVRMDSLPHWAQMQSLFDVGTIVGFTVKWIPIFDSYDPGTGGTFHMPRLSTAVKQQHDNTVAINEIDVLSQSDSLTATFDKIINRTCAKAVPLLSEGVEGTLTGAVSSEQKGLKWLNLDDVNAGQVQFGGVIAYVSNPNQASEADQNVGKMMITVTSAFKQQA